VISESSESEADVMSVKEEAVEGAPPLLSALTTQSSLNIAYYLCLALHSITFDQLLPVMMAYPPQDSSSFKLPFQFAGGLGMPSSQIGKMFSVYGMAGMTMQVRLGGARASSMFTDLG
jgi:hypothetical protein